MKKFIFIGGSLLFAAFLLPILYMAGTTEANGMPSPAENGFGHKGTDGPRIIYDYSVMV